MSGPNRAKDRRLRAGGKPYLRPSDGRLRLLSGERLAWAGEPPANRIRPHSRPGVNQTREITPEGGLERWGINPLSNHSEKFASVSLGYDGRTGALTVAGAPMRHLPYESREDPVNGASLVAPVEMFPLPSGGVAVVDRSG